jgi:hypothetical protein
MKNFKKISCTATRRGACWKQRPKKALEKPMTPAKLIAPALALHLAALASAQTVYLSDVTLDTAAYVWSVEPHSYAQDVDTLTILPGTGGGINSYTVGQIDPLGFASANVQFDGSVPAVGSSVTSLNALAVGLAAAQAQYEGVFPLSSEASAHAFLNYVVGIEFFQPTQIGYSAMLQNAFFTFMDAETGGQEVFVYHDALQSLEHFDNNQSPLVVQPGKYLVKWGMSVGVSVVGSPFIETSQGAFGAGIGFTPIPAPGSIALLLAGCAISPRCRRREQD